MQDFNILSYHSAAFIKKLEPYVVSNAPVEQRLKGLKPEELIAGLTPEELIAGLTPEEILDALPLEDIRAYLNKKTRTQ